MLTLRAAACLLAAILATKALAQGGTAFTYQGVLSDAGAPASGLYDVGFVLWDAPAGGLPVGGVVAAADVQVVDGRFTVSLDFGADSLAGDRWLQIVVEGVPLSPRQALSASPYSVQTRGVFVDSGYNVGIGTTSPDRTVDVVSDGEAVLRLSTLDTGLSTQSRIQLKTADGPSVFDALGSLEFLDANDTLRAAISANASGSTASQLSLSATPGELSQLNVISEGARLRGSLDIARRTDNTRSAFIGVDGEDSYFQLHGGRIGVGTESPLTDLHVAGSLRADSGRFGDSAAISFRSGEEDSVVINAHSDFGFAPAAYVSHVPRQWRFVGDVGIRTDAVAFALHVNGTAGKPGGGSWANSSDRRLKQNIEPLTGALDALLRVRGVTFEYIDPGAIDELPGTRVGVVAQEVEQVFPDWIDDRNDGYKAVTFRGFEAMTVEALRELRAEKDAQIDELKDENRALRERIDRLERLAQSGPGLAGG